MRLARTFKQRKFVDRLSYALSGFLIGGMAGLLIGYWVNQPVDTQILKYEQVMGEQAGRETVIERVIDGETIMLPAGEIIKLLGVDSPDKNQPCYEQAKSWLVDKATGKRIVVTKDGYIDEEDGEQGAWLWLGDESLNLALVREGLALADITPDMLLAEELISAEKEAKERNFGCLWAWK